MSNVFHGLGHAVLPRDTPLGQSHAERVMVQSRHPSGLFQGKPAIGIKAASQLDLDVPLAFARPERKASEDLIVNLDSDAHDQTIAALRHPVKPPPSVSRQMGVEACGIVSERFECNS